MLFPAYPENLIFNLEKSKVLSSVLALVILNIFILYIRSNRNSLRNLVQYASVLIPVIFIIPGAVEQRYGLAVWFTLCTIVCFDIDYIALWTYVKNHAVLSTLQIILISGLVIAIWTSMLATIVVTNPASFVVDYPLFIE